MSDILDEAVDVASAAYDMEGDRGGSHQTCIKAAIQAAVRILVPEERSIPKYIGDSATGAVFHFATYRDERVWNSCRAAILAKAGIVNE